MGISGKKSFATVLICFVSLWFPLTLLWASLIGDDVQGTLTPKSSGTVLVTPFVSSSVVVMNPGTEFTGELVRTIDGLTFSVNADINENYFSIRIQSTNDWGLITAIGANFEVELSDLDLPGGLGPVEFDPIRSVGPSPSNLEVNINELSFDPVLKKVKVGFGAVRDGAIYSFKLNNAPIDGGIQGILNVGGSGRTKLVTPFTTSLVNVINPGIEFAGEASHAQVSDLENPRTFSVEVDIFEDYFTVTTKATNDWGSSGGFGLGGASVYEVKLLNLIFPSGVGPVEFDPTRSVGTVFASQVEELNWDPDLKMVKVGFNFVRNGGTWAFKLQSANTAPIADAGDNRALQLLGLVTLDGTQSLDPDDDPITYAWTLDAPTGSTAVLDDPTSATPRFTADLYGNYVGLAEKIISHDPLRLPLGIVDSFPL